MRLISLTLITLVAFAANSILNRLGLVQTDMGPAAFAAVRLVSGAVVLLALVAMRDNALRMQPFTPVSVFSLLLYVLGFSFAYVVLDAGLGALLLFGGVQVTMFIGAAATGAPASRLQWLGMGISFLGLVLLSWPSDTVQTTPLSITLMVMAAIGWGVYSLAGAKSQDPLRATAWNFAYAAPFALFALFIFHDAGTFSTRAYVYAIASGAITSGLGYALWYYVLPQLGAIRAALAQLIVPVIALALGVLLLGEVVTAQTLISCAIVCGGIAIGIYGKKSSSE